MMGIKEDHLPQDLSIGDLVPRARHPANDLRGVVLRAAFC